MRQTRPLDGSRATRPLGRPGGVDLLAQLGEVVRKLVEATGAVRPALELMYQACRRAALPLPGVRQVELEHEVSAKGEAIIVYLVDTFEEDPEGLPRRVQVAVFRFYDATDAVPPARAALEAVQVPPALLEQLRLKLYHVMHYHLEFRDEPVLRQLFGGPRTLTPPPMTNAQRIKQKMKLEAAMEKAESLLYAVDPVIPLVRRVVETLDQRRGFSLAELLQPELRTVRIIAMGLGPDETARQLLRDALANHRALRQAVEAARKSKDPTGLEDAAFPLSGFMQACRAHALLRALFPASETA
jgi:hypothetical protein